MNSFTDLVKEVQAEKRIKKLSEKSLPELPVMKDFSEVFFKVSIKDHRFLYISPSCTCMLGFPPAYFISGGLRKFFQLWKSGDLTIYMDKIFPNDCKFLKNWSLM